MPGYLKFLEKVATPALGNGCSENFKKSGKSFLERLSRCVF